jgi:hypothetical protein
MLTPSLLHPVCLLAGVALLAGCGASPVRLEVEGVDLMRLVDGPTCYCAQTYPAPSLTVWATNPTGQGLTLPVNPNLLGPYHSRWWLVFQQDFGRIVPTPRGRILTAPAAPAAALWVPGSGVLHLIGRGAQRRDVLSAGADRVSECAAGGRNRPTRCCFDRKRLRIGVPASND